MASTEMTVMPVILAKFKPRLEIGDYQRIGLNDRSSVLLLLRGDGDLFARTLVHGEINATRKLMSKVRRFSWEEGHGDDQIVRFSVLANDRSLSLYEVNTRDMLVSGSSEVLEGEDQLMKSLRQIQKATTKDMKFLLKKRHIECAFKTVELVGSCQSGCALLVDGHVLAVVSQSQTANVMRAAVRLHQSTEFANPTVHSTASPAAVSCVGGLVFALCSTGVINVYHLGRSKLVAVLDVKTYASEVEGVQFDEQEIFCNLSVSPTAACAVTSTSRDRLCLLHLHRYYEKYPGHIQSSVLGAGSQSNDFEFIDDDDWNDDEEEQQTNSQVVGDIWFRRDIGHVRSSLAGFESSTSVINVSGTGSGGHTYVQPDSLKQSQLQVESVGRLVDGLLCSAQTRPLHLHVTADIGEHGIDRKSIFSSLNAAVMAVCKPVESGREQTPSSVVQEPSDFVSTSCCVGFPDLPSGLSIKHVHLDATTLSVVAVPTSRRVTSLLRDSDEECGFIWLSDIKPASKLAAKYRFHEGVVVAAMARSESPVCLLSDSDAFVCIQDLSQEALVNKVLLFDNAKLAEGLCRLNHWERYSLPLNALERAVRHRQLDTIAFFLHSGGASQDGGVEQSHAARIFKYAPQLPPLAADQMESALQLLIGSVEENYGKRQQSQFAEQLLNLTLHFLQRLMEDQTATSTEALSEGLDSLRVVVGETTSGGVHSPTKEPPSLRKRQTSESSTGSVTSEVETRPLGSKIPLETLAGYVNRLRCLVKHPSVSPHPEYSDSRPAHAAALYEAIASGWRNMESGAIVKAAIQTDLLPLVQVFLNKERSTTAIANRLGDGGTDAELTSAIVRQISIRRASGNESDARMLNTSLLVSLIRVGTKYTLQSLLHKNVTSARKMLENMGCDVKTELRRICFATVYKPLRDLLALELMQNGWLTTEESDTISYAQIVERLYGSQNYDEVVAANPSEDSESGDSPPSWYKCGSVKPFRGFQLQIPKSYSPSSDQATTGYVQLSLDWVHSWDIETRERILLDKLCTTSGDEEEIGQLISARSRWTYYFAHNDWKALVQWIQQALPSLEPHSVSAGQIAAALVGVNEQQSWHHIPPHLWAVLPHSTHFTSEMVLDELARHGQFCEEELASFPMLLRRMSRVHNLFGHVHPLAALRRPEGATTEGMIVTPLDFHKQFLLHCIKNRLVNIMYEYMDHYRLGFSAQDISTLGLDGEQKDWVHVLIKFRVAAAHRHDHEAVFAASLANSQLVLQPFAGSRNVVVTVQDMLDHDRTLMALGTLMYAPVSIEDAMSRRGEVWSVDAHQLRRALAAYPKIQAAVFPDHSSDNKTAAELQDVSLYELLQSSEACDVSRLFRWQSTNNLDTDDESLMQEMPHFSHPALVSRYAYKETLPFTYYLLKGRPSFAFGTFASQHKVKGSMAPKRLMAGYWKAYRLALRHFSNPPVSASCVAFVEMLGQDSSVLRVDIESAIRLYDYCCAESTKVRSVEPSVQPEGLLYLNKADIVDDLLTASALNATAVKVMKRLEYATQQAVSGQGLQKTSTAAAELWQLVLTYCRARDLPLCNGFLVECAANQDWLAFVCHAQENRFPANKVLEIIDQEFSNPHLREHLHLTFKSIMRQSDGTWQKKSGRQRAREQKKAKKEQRLQKERNVGRAVAAREQRARLYTRIGVPQTAKLPGSVAGVGKQDTLPEESKEAAPAHEKLEEEAVDIDAEPEQPLLIAEELPSNVFDVLLSCQTYEQPWQAMLAHAVALERSLLAILAACQQDAEMLDCACVWLYVTCGSEVLGPALTHIKDSVQWHHWSLTDLHSMLIVASEHRPTVAKAMSLALEYFDPDNLLLDFLHFHEAVTIQMDFVDALKHLKKLNVGLDKCDADGKYPGKIGNRIWMEQLCGCIADIVLLKCPDWMLSRFLTVMSEAPFGESFSSVVTDYTKLNKIFKILEKAEIDPSICFAQGNRGDGRNDDGLPNSPESWLVSNHPVVLQTLLDQCQFEAAREYADALGLASDTITERQVLSDLETFQLSDLWKTSQGRAEFWWRCHDAFVCNKCSPETAGHFFEALLNHPSTAGISQRERAVVLEYALHWYNKGLHDQKLNGKIELEKNMWLCRIRGVMELQKETHAAAETERVCPWFVTDGDGRLSSSALNAAPTNLSDMLVSHKTIATALSSVDIDRWLEMVNHGKLKPVLESYEEQMALETVIGQVLDDQDVLGACRLSTLFRHSTVDLEIVVSCLRLAAGHITFSELSSALRLRIEDMTHDAAEHRPGLQSRLASEPTWDQGYGDLGQMTTYLDMLSNLCDYGKKICLRSAISFKMALLLRSSYESVLETSPFDVLLQLLSSNMVHKYSQAEKFIAACVLSPTEVAGFLSEGIVKALHVHFGEGSLSPGKPGLIFNPSSPPEEFQSLARLCSNPSLLGNRLLEDAVSLASSTADPTFSSLSVEVELMILSHECHTVACNMEGIASILRLARQRTPYVARAKQFKLMVHLLVSIGRYREMYFILDSLRRHEQFEMLLQSGSNKHEKLKRALLEYLWRPQDKSLREMVALHLTMYRAVADMHKQEADKQLVSLRGVRLEPSFAFKQALSRIVEQYTDAAENFFKDECLHYGQRCQAKANLVALQMRLLVSGVRVICLSTKEVVQLMSRHTNFQDCLVVAEAYKMRSLSSWIEPLYNQVIVNGNFYYYEEFRRTFPTKSSLHNEIVSRYRRDSIHSGPSVEHMKRLLLQIPQLHLRHKYAQELGFRDVAAAVVEEESEEFLRDLEILG